VLFVVYANSGGVCICVGGMALMIHGGIGLGLCVVDIVRTTLADLFNLSSPSQRCYFPSFVVMFPCVCFFNLILLCVVHHEFLMPIFLEPCEKWKGGLLPATWLPYLLSTIDTIFPLIYAIFSLLLFFLIYFIFS